MSTLNELLARAQEVRDEQAVGGNTALRVGQLLTDIIQWCADTDADFVESVEHYVAQLNERDGIINWWQSRVLILKTMGSDFDDVDVSTLNDGDLYYDSVGKWLFEREDGGSVNGHHPSDGVLYVNKRTGKTYLWDDTEGEMVERQSPVKVINDLTTGGEEDALSAEQGKVLKGLIDNIGTGRFSIVDEHDNNSVLLAPSARQMKLMYNNIMAIYNGLANIAFTDGKPSLDWVGSKTKYTLSYGTLTGCRADVAAGQVNEGALRIKLTPTQASYAFTSVTVNGQSAQTTATGDGDGSVYLDIVVNGNITVAATAISGRAITFNGTGCTIDNHSVAIGVGLDTTIRSNDHFTLPQSITVKIDSTDVAHTYTRAQGNKTATLHINAENITGDLTIICTAVEDDFAVLDLTEVGSNVAVKRGSENLLEQETPVHVYAGDTISILPVGDNKVRATVTIGNTAATLQGNAYGGFTYTLDSNDVSSSGTAIAVSAEATALQTFNIVLSGVTSDVGVTWNTPSAAVSTILEGSPFSVTLVKVSGTGVLQIGTCTMSGGTLTPNNGVIETAHVTGNITIAASVAEAHMKVHSYAYPATSELVGETTEEFIEDTKGDFNLFKYTKGEGGTSETFSPSPAGGSYPNNSYANGINSDPAYRLGKSTVGDRVIGVEDGGDFTVILKGVKPKIETGPTGYMYNNNQPRFYFVDRDVNTTTNQQYFPSLGQFLLSLGSKSSSQSQRYMYPRLDYSNGSLVSSVFYFAADSEHGESIGCISKSVASQTTLDANTSFDMVVTYDAGTKTAKAWIMKTDSNDSPATKTLMYSGEITTSYVLKMPCISLPSNNYVAGLDVYNYAMTENEIAAKLDATIAPIPEPAS